jgi:polyisoprenoid-binding protein YceI
VTRASAATRVLGGAELPAAGLWKVDPGHAEVAFVGRHFLLTKVRGRFTGVDAEVCIGEDPAASTVTVTIDMASVHSGDGTRDSHLRSSDLFDVANHPTATFRSTAVAWDGTSGTLTGDLTIKGVTKPVELTGSYTGTGTDPWGNERVGLEVSTTVDRREFGLGWNQPLPGGGLLVSNDVTLLLSASAVKGE